MSLYAQKLAWVCVDIDMIRVVLWLGHSESSTGSSSHFVLFLLAECATVYLYSVGLDDTLSRQVKAKQ